MGASLAQQIAALPAPERAKRMGELAATEQEAAALEYAWRFWARPEQLAPAGPWGTWLISAGRGFGKSRSGAEWVRERIAAKSPRIALVARTAADVRDVIVEGESGILACSPPWDRPVWEPSKRRLTWRNGCRATTYSADEPGQLRGPQHSDAWADELAAWRYPDAWDQLLFGLRLGRDPRVVVTTTPRPTPLIRALVSDASCVVTRGTTFDNAGNLAPTFLRRILAKYQGTRLGQQELYAELLDDAPGALWKRTAIAAARVWKQPAAFRTVVIAVDPATTSNENSDETGIVVVGRGFDDHAYVLEDLTGRYTPGEWAGRVVAAFDHHRANRVIAEINQGGEMVAHTLRSVRSSLPITVIHASRGKALRAEPVALLAEQGKVHHVGVLPELEDELCSWQPGDADSPNRLDALVYGVTAELESYQTSAGQPPRVSAEREQELREMAQVRDRLARTALLRGSLGPRRPPGR